jgi:hypothetical protein
MRRPLAGIFFCVLAIGCGGATEGQLRARAGNDLHCPPETLHVDRVDRRTRTVSGCGSRATYIEVCQEVISYDQKRDCAWVSSGDRPEE